MVYTKVKKFFQSYIVGLGNRQAFSQTMTAGCPKGMFSHKIIRDFKSEFSCISSKMGIHRMAENTYG